MLRKNGTTLALVLVSLLAAAACGDTNGGSLAGSGNGRVSLLLTDAPGDVDAAVVTITDAYLQPGDSATGRLSLLQNADVTVDLLDLRNQLRALADSVTVPAGSYSQLRLVVSGAAIRARTNTGTEVFATSPTYPGLSLLETSQVDGELKFPSAGTSGLKIVVPGGLTVAPDGDETLLLDFDVAQSFGHEAGNSGKWIMHPVIRAARLQAATTVEVSVALGDSVSLPVGIALSGFQVRLTDKSGNVTTAALDDAGHATFRYLNPDNGPFQLELVAPAGASLTLLTAPALPLSVQVISGETVTENLTLTSLTAG